MSVRATGPMFQREAVPAIGPDLFAAVLAASAEATALLDERGNCIFVNPAACAVLGGPADGLLGRRAPFASGPDAPALVGQQASIRWRPPGSPREREIEYRARSVTADGRQLTVVTFRDVTDLRAERRRFTAFATAAANVAYARSLRSTLDAICAELVGTTDLAGAQTFLIDASGTRMRVHGAAPADRWPADFAVRLEQARGLGARLLSFEAVQAGKPLITRRRKAQMLADPRWAPLHDQLDSFAWEDFVAVPLVVRERTVGALNAYYKPGHEPDNEEIAFLTAMADQAAVAVENARLLAEVRSEAELDERYRLARELHDSACQRLFSMNLHIRAAELARAPVDDALLQTLGTLVRAALEDMRASIFELRPTLLDTEGLVATVREQAEWIKTRGGPSVVVEGPDERLELEAEAELDLFRLSQEALHNCVKHAAATRVDVRIGPAQDDPRTLVLEVSDDGDGFDPARTTPGLGLVSIRERSERLGGELAISPRPQGGTIVRLVIPRILGSFG